jgi:hypothetical protein
VSQRFLAHSMRLYPYNAVQATVINASHYGFENYAIIMSSSRTIILSNTISLSLALLGIEQLVRHFTFHCYSHFITTSPSQTKTLLHLLEVIPCYFCTYHLLQLLMDRYFCLSKISTIDPLHLWDISHRLVDLMDREIPFIASMHIKN